MRQRFDKVYIEITNDCNLSCSFCAGTDRAVTCMSEPDFISVLDQLGGFTSTVYFHVMGEPFLHPQLPLFVKLAGERGFKVNLTTNATLVTKRAIELMGMTGFARINLSVQSFEQFDADERIIKLDNLITTIKDLVLVQRIVQPHFLASFRFWTRDDGVFSEPLLERLIAAFVSKGEQQPVTQDILSGRNGCILGPGVVIHAADSFEWPNLCNSNTVMSGFCRGLRDQLGVLVDGTVVPCCLDRNGDVSLGNLLDTPLAEILSGARAKKLYDGFSNRYVVEPLCKGCTFRQRFS